MTSSPKIKTDKRSLPDSWRLISLGEITTTLETGSRPKGGALGISKGIPSLSAEHMTNYGKFDFSELRYVPQEFYEQMTRGHIQRDDVLIVKDGATTGKTVFIDEDFPFNKAVINEHVFICRFDLEVADPKYIFYYLWSNEGQKQIKQSFQGAAIGGINQGFVDKVILPLPPLDEQKRIAKRLNKELSTVESARKAAEEQLQAALELPSAYLSKIFDNTETQWKREKLDHVCELLPAKAIKTIGNRTVTAITSACLTENGFSPDGLKSARMDENDAKVALVKKDEILIARSNTPELVGRVSIYTGDPPDVVASDLTIRIWAKPPSYPPFLTSYLSYLYLSGYWREKAGGASGTMKKITRSQLLEISVPVPDINIQKKIVDEMQDKMSNFKQLQQSLESQLEEINALPSALLRRAVEGGL